MNNNYSKNLNYLDTLKIRRTRTLALETFKIVTKSSLVCLRNDHNSALAITKINGLFCGSMKIIYLTCNVLKINNSVGLIESMRWHQILHKFIFFPKKNRETLSKSFNNNYSNILEMSENWFHLTWGIFSREHLPYFYYRAVPTLRQMPKFQNQTLVSI